MKAIDLTGRKFGKLTVVGPARPRKGARFWRCECDCGTQKIASGSNLTYGNVKTCGCGPRGNAPKPYNKPAPRPPASPPVAQDDGSVLWTESASASTTEAPTMRVSLSRLAFMDQENPHDWSKWSRE